MAMMIEIPDDLARKAKSLLLQSGDEYRHIAEQNAVYDPLRSFHALARAALANADFPEPVQVGHLATWDGCEVLVLAVGQRRAFVRTSEGAEMLARHDWLTYAGPAPARWGQ